MGKTAWLDQARCWRAADGAPPVRCFLSKILVAWAIFQQSIWNDFNNVPLIRVGRELRAAGTASPLSLNVRTSFVKGVVSRTYGFDIHWPRHTLASTY
jgi:hypothetical protein